MMPGRIHRMMRRINSFRPRQIKGSLYDAQNPNDFLGRIQAKIGKKTSGQQVEGVARTPSGQNRSLLG